MIWQFENSVNDTDEYNQTQLYEAAHDLKIDTVRFLLKQKGLDVSKMCTRDLDAGEAVHANTERDEIPMDMISRKLAQHRTGVAEGHLWYLTDQKMIDYTSIRQMLTEYYVKLPFPPMFSSTRNSRAGSGGGAAVTQ